MSNQIHDLKEPYKEHPLLPVEHSPKEAFDIYGNRLVVFLYVVLVSLLSLVVLGAVLRIVDYLGVYVASFAVLTAVLLIAVLEGWIGSTPIVDPTQSSTLTTTVQTVIVSTFNNWINQLAGKAKNALQSLLNQWLILFTELRVVTGVESVQDWNQVKAELDELSDQGN